MDEENRKIYFSAAEADGDFDLEDILEEYGTQTEEYEIEERESLEERSKRIVMDGLSVHCEAVGLSSLDDVIRIAVAEQTQEAPEPEEEPAAEEEPVEPVEETPPEFSPEEEALIEELQASAERVSVAEVNDAVFDTDYASAPENVSEDLAEEPVPQTVKQVGSGPKKTASQPNLKERIVTPILALLALVALRTGQKKPEREKTKTMQSEQPEPEPGKAARRCASLMNSLRFRGRVSALMCLFMVYISYAAGSSLPLTGALKSGTPVQALLLLIMELTVIMAGLDIFTEGLVSIVRKKPTARSLLSVSCVLTVIDALIIALSGNGSIGLPFCAVSALSMTFAIWGEFFGCSGRRTGYRVLTSGKNVYTVSGENGLTPGETALMKSRRGIRGFVRRSEAEDYSDRVFGILAPVLVIASVVLGILASVFHGAGKNIVHYISALCAASAAFSATLCFSLPFAIAARCLARSGAAVAGWSGAEDIGSCHHVVITDGDLFPRGTVEVGNIRVLEGAFVDKVISYTGSVIAASGSGLSESFAELIRRNGYTVSRVENFEPHDGGGMTAVVNGDTVCVGSTGFMNLMGIRVPRKISTKNSVYTAINGALVGIFAVEYRPTAGVQDALVTILHTSLEPIFAIRDFNITPQMIKTSFRMPTDDFKFPAYGERFRISGSSPSGDSPVAAAIVREGVGPLVDAAERGRRLYTGVRIGTLISAAGGVFGLLMMFLLSWSGSFDGASVGNVITFMLLWLIPTVVIAWGIQR